MINAEMLPYRVNIIAKYPLPLRSSLWPGKIDKNESSSGAPRKIDGIKSMNVCAIAIEVIKIVSVIGEIVVNKVVDIVRVITAMRFIWIPGVSPVRVPARIPINIARIISSNIFVKIDSG